MEVRGETAETRHMLCWFCKNSLLFVISYRYPLGALHLKFHWNLLCSLPALSVLCLVFPHVATAGVVVALACRVEGASSSVGGGVLEHLPIYCDQLVGASRRPRRAIVRIMA